MNIIKNIITTIADFYTTSLKINNVVSTIISILVIYKPIYFILGIFFTRKFKKSKKKHKYGICIAARNEKNVIGNLIDSINNQDYPKELYTVFVVADNCTDNTAEIARNKGAICYERFDEENKTKGFALQFLFKNIEKDYGTDNFEGYFIFDADNLLKKDYLTKMNNAFDEGCKIITSYRNTKNFDENWIASTYALHWIRSARINHRARSILHLATNIQGTGFLFTNEIVLNGWNYTSLTEDRALTADAVAQGYQITYQDEAIFYDEQPTSLKIALRQRLRWSKGHLQAFVESGPYLFMNIFTGKRFLKTKWNNKQKKTNIKEKIVESIRHRFASFDTLIQLTPLAFIEICRWLIFSIIIYSFYTYKYGLNDKLLSINININAGIKAMLIAIIITICTRIIYRIGTYFSNMLMAIYLFIIERKRIKKTNFKKIISFIITWPTFDIIGRYTTYIAIFKKVTWKPIPHESKVTIKDLE